MQLRTALQASRERASKLDAELHEARSALQRLKNAERSVVRVRVCVCVHAVCVLRACVHACVHE